MAQGDLSGQGFKVIALVPPRGRLAQVPIKHLKAFGMPAQVFGPTDQGPLRAWTVEMLTRVLQARLANGDHRLAFEMSRGNFHLTQTEIGEHGQTVPRLPLH